jgi:hypothetical protein
MNFDWRNWTIFGALRLVLGALVVSVFVFILSVLAESNVRHFFEDRGWDTFLTRALAAMPDLLHHQLSWLVIGLIFGSAAAIWLIWAFPQRLGDHYTGNKSGAAKTGTAVAVIVLVGGAFYLAVNEAPSPSPSNGDITKATAPLKAEIVTLKQQLENAQRMKNTSSSALPQTTPLSPSFSDSYDLTENDVRKLRDELFNIRNLLPSHVAFSTADDQPARRVANKLAKAFGLAGVSPAGMSVGYPTTPQEMGISIRVANLQKIPEGAIKAAEAIKKVTDVEPRFTAFGELNPDSFAIFVGTDPKEK